MSISKTKPFDLIEIMYLLKVSSIETDSVSCFYLNSFKLQVSDLIDKGNLYSYRKNESTVGILALHTVNTEEYKKIKWEFTSGNILPVRIIVHPKWRESRVCSELLAYTEQYAIKNNFQTLRLDFYSSNTNALNMLNQSKYEKAGEIILPFQTSSLLCFEKQIAI